MVKTALINPPLDPKSEGTYEKWAPHLGLGYLAASLLQAGFKCEVIDAKFEGIDFKDVCERVKRYKPDIVGITMVTEDFRSASHIGNFIKAFDPEIITIVGGPHPTAVPARTLRENENYDIAVEGEGEYTLRDIVSVVESGNLQRLRNVQGITYRSNGEIIRNKPRQLIEDLDSLLFPAWELFKTNENTLYPMVTARGCPFGCIFCQPLYGKKVRFRSATNLLDEVDYLISKFKCRKITFQDDTFTLNRKRITEFLDEFIRREYSRKIEWICETRVTSVDQDLLKKIKEAGCVSIGFGVESGNEDILKIIKKGITKGQARNAIRWAKEVGLFVRTFFILGHPYETEETAKETISFAKELNADMTTFSIMTPIPGTEVEQMAEKGIGGLRLLSKDYSDYSLQLSKAMELEQLPISKLKHLQLKGYLSFYLQPKKFGTLLRFINKKRLLGIAWHYAKESFTKWNRKNSAEFSDNSC